MGMWKTYGRWRGEGDEEAMGRESERESEIKRKMIWNIVGATNLMWRYLGKPKNFLSASAFSLY